MSDRFAALRAAVADVSEAAWAVGVSGGADSVALLALLRERSSLSLTVVHLNHEVRGPASADDAQFVADLAQRLNLPCVIARRSDVQKLVAKLPRNLPAQLRALRMALFRQVIDQQRLQGVLLAHHADDQAETVFQRLLRGSGAAGLAGMRRQARVSGMLVVRPLLEVSRQALREYLQSIGQPWREDESNVADVQQRNRVRKLLAAQPSLREPLLQLAEKCAAWRNWLREHAPELPEAFELETVRKVPRPLGREALRQWLIERGAPAGDLDVHVLTKLLDMTEDAASPARQHFPGGLLVRRRKGRMFVDAVSET